MMTKKRITSVYLSLLLYAFFLTLLGQLLPRIIETYSLTMGEAGLFSTLQSIGGFIAIFVCIFIVDSLNKIKILGLSILLFSIMTMIIGFKPVLSILYIVFALLGIAASFINTLTNVVIVDDTKEKYKRLLINLLHAFFSVGAVIGPIISEVITREYSWQTVFVLFASAVFLCSMFYMFSFRKDVIKPLKVRKIEKSIFKEAGNTMRIKGMPHIAVISICICFMQFGIMYWLSTYVSALKGNYSHGAFALTMFFIGIMISRMGLSKLSTKMNRAKLIAVGSLLSSLFFVIALFIPNPYVAAVFFLLCGVALAQNIPQMVSLACELVPNNPGTASGIVFFGLMVSTLISPLCIGALADVIGLKFALIMPAIINFVGVVAAFKLRKMV